MKKLYIKSYGCQMNVYDSGRMADVLAPLGFSQAEDYIDSDMVVLNTCHIREKASEKIYSELGRIRQEKERRKKLGGDMIIAVAGCVAQAEGHEIFSRAPFVDIVVGPQSYHRLPELVAKVESHGARGNGLAIDLDFPEVSKFDLLPAPSGGGVSEFLSIQEGCDQFCTFCVVPYTRGAEYSRNVPEIYREALTLTQNGAIELTLLGQNVNAYHGLGLDGETINLAKLIRHLAKIPALKRIRYTTSHPLDMDDELIALHGAEEKLMPFLHLPVQSGSDAILKAMNRKHDVGYYRKVIEKLRRARPDIAFSSDFIVGFPGETDEDFAATMGLVEEIGYAQAYSFKYSPRPGTPAADKETQVPEAVKDERLQQLQELISHQQRKFNESFVGRETEVLFDRKGKYHGQIMGRSPWMQSVHVKDGEAYAGKLMPVIITEGRGSSLAGEIVKNIPSAFAKLATK